MFPAVIATSANKPLSQSAHLLARTRGGGCEKERLNVAKPGVKIGALMPLHTVCGMGTILLVAYAPATNRAFLHPTSAPSAF